jgi:hypothetical protein
MRTVPSVQRSWWLLCCTFDGWRERVPPRAVNTWAAATPELDQLDEWRGPPGVLPVLSERQPWVACFCRQEGDGSGLLLPEAHYLKFGGYRALFRSVSMQRRPWWARATRGVFAGGDHGDAVTEAAVTSSRRALAEVVRSAGLPVDVALGGSVSRRRQLGYRYLLDVDGFVRTFDAWAWKLASGSVVLSQASHWQTMFTTAFAAWEHYVPVARDFGDLAERLEWCLTHDDECRAIAGRARRRAYEVYAPDNVRREARATLTAALLG